MLTCRNFSSHRDINFLYIIYSGYCFPIFRLELAAEFSCFTSVVLKHNYEKSEVNN